MKCRPN